MKTSEKGVKILTKKEKGQDRHWKNFLDKDYLGSHNLEKGEEMLLTIAKFEGEEEVDSQEGKKVKQVLYFKENVPKMILNITNGNTLANLYGSHPEHWIGKQIQVYAASVKAFGKTQDALRIRDFRPKITVDVPKMKAQLEKAKTLEELKGIWTKLPVSARNDAELIHIKNVIKDKLQ
jgi:hypothetical protein